MKNCILKYGPTIPNAAMAIFNIFPLNHFMYIVIWKY